MPNHIKNVWTIKNLKPIEIDDILNRLTSQIEHEVYPLNCIIDFDKIIPEPKRIEDCPKECIVAKDSHIEDDKDRPWFDWFAWHNKYWGTKWGAYKCYTKIGRTYITFVFNTAWNLATPILEKLEDLNHDLDIRFADENLGDNCGRLMYSANKREWHSYEYKDLYKFASQLWNKY